MRTSPPPTSGLDEEAVKRQMTELAVEFFTAKLDRTAPEITLTAPADLLGESVSADFSCTDEEGGSGLKEGSCTAKLADGTTVSNNAPLDTSTVGEKTLTVRAEDNAGNVAEKVVHYRVVYDFSGLSGRLGERDANGNYVLNELKAGGTVPVKFSLGGDRGEAIMASGYPQSQQINCDPTAEVTEGIATVDAGSSSLRYDPDSGQYIYNWKTNGDWSGSCRQLVVKLNDGTVARASFKFR